MDWVSHPFLFGAPSIYSHALDRSLVAYFSTPSDPFKTAAAAR